MVGNFGHIPSHQHALLLASSICWRTLKFDRQRKQAIIKVARGGEVQVRRGDVGGGMWGAIQRSQLSYGGRYNRPIAPRPSAAPGACLEGGDLLSYTIYPNTCSSYQPNHNVKRFLSFYQTIWMNLLQKHPQHVLTIPTKPHLLNPRHVLSFLKSWTLFKGKLQNATINWSPVNAKTTFFLYFFEIMKIAYMQVYILDMSDTQCRQAMGYCLLKCHTEIVTSQWVVDKFTHVHIVMVAI